MNFPLKSSSSNRRGAGKSTAKSGMRKDQWRAYDHHHPVLPLSSLFPSSLLSCLALNQITRRL
jgi:hypothetical protein